MIFIKHKPFLFSVLGGILTWLFLFFLFPASVVNPFSIEAFFYIISCFLCLVLGYFSFQKQINTRNSQIIISKEFIYSLIIICVISFGIRYLDLFFFRKISLSNSVWENRELLDKTKPNFIFTLSSIIKHIYFIPLILYFTSKLKDKILFILSVLLFVLPFLEGYIRGSRNIFFISIFLLFFTLIYFKKITINKKNILKILACVFIFFLISTAIIMEREEVKTDKNYTSLTTDFFLNKFLKPKPKTFKILQSSNNQNFKRLYVSGFQILQYYVHGVFEFDNLVKHYKKEKLNYQLSKFTFFEIFRFTNKYQITNADLNNVQQVNPRQITFITFFGGLYVDFGWFGLLFMFFFGIFQRFLVNVIKNGNTIFTPILIFLLFSNFFMLTFNFFKSVGVHIIISFLFCYLLFKLSNIKTIK